MPLKTYTGPTIGPILERIQAELGDDAEVARVEQRRGPGGRPELVVTAGDPASVRAAERGRVLRAERVGDAPATAAPAPVATSRAAPEVADARRAAVAGGVVLAPVPAAGRQVLAFVGPTGAGKTTTVAKLALHPRILAGRTVGILTLDTFKVGAVEQLAQYAELADRPLEVAYEPGDVPAALRRLGRCDVVLVDCPGRGPRAQRDADLVRQMLAVCCPVETHLVLPSGLRPEFVRRQVEAYRRHGVTHLLATKVDECPDDWSVFDVAAAEALPMRWLGDGQAVPQDVRAAEARLHAARGARRGAAGAPMARGVA